MFVVSTAQSMLHRVEDKSTITPLLIVDTVDVVMGSGLVDASELAVFDKQSAVAELIRRFSIWIGPADPTLCDNYGHKPWLDSARKKDWHYWQRYQEFLERKMSVTVVDAIDRSTDKILGLLEDPMREGPWDRRGLVVGHVQSGKTPSDNVPYKFSSIYDTSKPGFGYCNSDLKNPYLSREQLNGRMVAPTINLGIKN